MLVILGLLVAAIVVAATSSYYYYPPPPPPPPMRLECSVGERANSKMGLCEPIIAYPIPVLEELKDATVSPCDSFFHSQSGNWISHHKNANRAFGYVSKRNQRLIEDIIKDPTSGPVNRFYQSCVDTLVLNKHEALDKAQLKHVKQHILGAFKSHADLPVVFARLASYGFTSPFAITVESHPTESKMVPLVRYDGFPLGPDDLIRYANMVGMDVFKISNMVNAVRKLNAMHTDVEFEGSYLDYVKSRQYALDMTTMGTLLDAAPANFWKLYLRELNGFAMESEMDLAQTPVWIIDRNYVGSLLRGLTSLTVAEWLAYFTLSIRINTYDFVPELPSNSYFRRHEYAPIKRSAQVPHRLKRYMGSDPVDEATCVAITHNALPGLISRSYLVKDMPNYEQTRQHVIRIVERVRDKLADMISRTSWMEPETRAKTVDKIRAIIVRAVKPNYWEPEPFADRITTDNYLRNLNLVRRYRALHNFELWTSGTPNRDLIQRFISPLTDINAFFAPSTNTITIFAGILTEPFYSSQYSEVVLYATIGMIAGHELSHAIDSHGHWFDKNGNVPPAGWWTNRDQDEFNARAQCITTEYQNGPEQCDAIETYGEQTLGENIADIVGMRAAYEAAPIKSVSDGRIFFETFAQLWAETYDKSVLCDRAKNDEHSIALFRVDKTLRQMTEFAHTYACQSGSKMVNDKPCILFG